MIKDCHSFERRIQQLMDSRIDPETDEALWKHSADCDDCYQSLLACSLMHSEFLNDSDSMKIKLDTIGLHDLKIRREEKSERRSNYYLTLVASLAALVVLSISLLPDNTVRQSRPIAHVHSSYEIDLAPDHSAVDAFTSLSHLREALDPYQLTSISSEWSPIQPISTLSGCISWIQRSWRRVDMEAETQVDETSADLRDLQFEILQAEIALLALR